MGVDSENLQNVAVLDLDAVLSKNSPTVASLVMAETTRPASFTVTSTAAGPEFRRQNNGADNRRKAGGRHADIEGLAAPLKSVPESPASA